MLKRINYKLMKNNITVILASLLIVSASLILSTSCNKHDKPQAIITTYKMEGSKQIPLEGVIVKIFSDASLYDTAHKGDVSYVDPDSLFLKKMLETGETGSVTYESEYEQILQVYASYPLSKNDSIVGYGAIILKEDEVYEESIILKPQNVNP